jgi:hypothetical protein
VAEQNAREPKKQDQVMAERKAPTAMSHHPSAGTLSFVHAPAMAYYVPGTMATKIEESKSVFVCEPDARTAGSRALGI